MPWRLSSASVAKICLTMSGASPSDGSSSMSSFGRLISARAMASICCSPPESVPPRCVEPLLETRKERRDALEILVEVRLPVDGRAHLQVLEHRHALEDAPPLRRPARS